MLPIDLGAFVPEYEVGFRNYRDYWNGQFNSNLEGATALSVPCAFRLSRAEGWPMIAQLRLLTLPLAQQARGRARFVFMSIITTLLAVKIHAGA